MTDRLDGPPTCLPGGSAWSGMHCLHPTERQVEVRCCGPCGGTYTHPSYNGTATASSGFSYRLGASHTEPGPFWPAVRAAMPRTSPVTA